MTTAATEPDASETAVTATDRPIVYVNGKMLPKSQAVINVFDHGLLYGDGIFEGIRIYGGKIFKCRSHMDRLWRCAERTRLLIPVSHTEMIRIMRECVRANEIVDGYIRLVITRGVGNLGLNPFTCPTAGVICIADQIRLFPPELYAKGMKVIVAERPRIPVECLDPRIKSLNYLNNILAKVEAIDKGLLEVVMLNTDGYVAEGSGDNVFFVKNGTVVTPPPEAGILEGITRQFVLETLCPKLGIAAEQRLFKLDELFGADEVFLTGTAAEIIAVTQIDSHVISPGEGPITSQLRTLFRHVVTSDNLPED
ncbi:MAG: branched-chain-amino-acid transaminase [Planctomycetes bacterium]|nr:branched-chain-amino-acid transaminase [Planctomycetota bacterium]